MNNIFFTPGPSQLYFTAEQHIKQALREQIGSISHRSKAFMQLYAHTEKMLRMLLQVPDNHEILFLSSATEIWERIIQNCVNRESLHFVYGSFSKRFYQTAIDYQKSAEAIHLNPDELGKISDYPIKRNVELVALTQNETSLGISLPDSVIHDFRQKGDFQVAVDAVSGLPFYQPDFEKIDHLYFSVQKGFGLPAGLGVWIVSPKAIKAHEDRISANQICGSHHSLTELLAKAKKQQTPETPNVLALYLLGKVAEDMLNKGIQQIRNETIYKNVILDQCIEQSDFLEHYKADKQFRSKTVMVANTTVDASLILNALDKKGLVVGSGYGDYKNTQIRIANFPAHSKEQFEMLVDLLSSQKF